MSDDHRPTDADVLLRALAAQRAHVLGILDGLDDDALRRPVLPSGWSCVALVRHLTLDDERFWFRAVVAGEQAAIEGLAPDSRRAWQVPDDVAPQAVLDAYRRETELADAALSGLAMDAPLQWWPDALFGDWRLHTVREVVLHMITETACHAGHLDAARELLDGRTWLVLED